MANAKRKTNNATRNADDATVTEEEQPKRSMNRQLAKYRDVYRLAISGSGKTSLHNGDKIAKALEGLPLEQLLAAASTIFEVDLVVKYGHLNQGQMRMNTGNRIRAAYKNPDHKYHKPVMDWVHARLA